MAEPYMPFYVDAWLGDERLAEASFAARGLWIAMLGLMWRATPRGHLVVAGKALREDDVVAITRQTRASSPAEVKKLLAELRELEVFSIADDGTIYSRRMVRDGIRTEQLSKHGRRGAEAARQKRRREADPLWVPNAGADDASASSGGISGGDDADQRGAPTNTKLSEANTESANAASGAAERVQRPVTEPFGLADWFWGEAAARGLIPVHRLPNRDRDVVADVVAAKTLLGAYPVEDIQRRALRFLDALQSGELIKSSATVRGLAHRWDFACVAPPRKVEQRNERPAGRQRGRLN